MNRLLKLEELGLFLLSLLLFAQLSYASWVYPLLLLAPDLGMIGHAFGPRVGAMAYNTTHHLVIHNHQPLLAHGAAQSALGCRLGL